MSERLDTAYAEILAHPEDDAPRLRYAELAGGEIADLIRRGIKLRDMRRKGQFGRYDPPTKTEIADVVRRNPELGVELVPYVDSFDLGRGFIERISLPAAKFVEHAPTLFARAPILHARLTRAHGLCGALAASPQLAKLLSLDLSLNQLDDADVLALARSPHLGRLLWLELKQNRIGEVGLDALAAATASRMPSLRYLGIAINECEDPVDEAIQDENGVFTFRPRAAGSVLEGKYGPLQWVHFQSETLPDPEALY